MPIIKPIQHPRERLLVALDVANLSAALHLVEQLRDHVGGFKVGMELCSAAGVPQVVEAISAAGGEVFLDLKFKDIPNTVAGAVRAIAEMYGTKVRMLTLHCDGGSAMLRAAVSAVYDVFGTTSTEAPLLLGVTVLTSMDVLRMAQVGVRDPLEVQVVRLAQLAQMSGLSGVIASPHEVAAVKRACGAGFLCITPGVRPAWAATGDQQRFMTPAGAIAAGADYLVIGRPITAAPPGTGGPVVAAQRLLEEIVE
jgi:orotidine-5'-phosphate decarboxylase